MSYRVNNDNAYPVGSRVYARANPAVYFVIRKYYQRIYYCQPIDEVPARDAVFFEGEIASDKAVS